MPINNEKGQEWLRGLYTQEIVSFLHVGLVTVDELREAYGLSPLNSAGATFTSDNERDWEHKDSCACDECMAEAELLCAEDELDLIRMGSESPRGED